MMANDTQDGQTDRQLIERIEALGRPRVLGDFLQESAGVFLPGFTALPAVTILSNRSWKTRIKPQPERWRSGEIMALKATSGTQADSKQQTVFFTPVGDVTIPLIDMTPGRDLARFEKTIQLKPKDRWESTVLQFALLPWDAERESREWTSEELLSVSRVIEIAARRLRVWLDIDGQRVALRPSWGIRDWIAKSALDSIRFPINHAHRVIGAFIFRLSFEPTQKLPDGRVVELTKETLTINFEYPEDALRQLYLDAGLGQPELSGISVFGNAVPVMNLDLKAWIQGDSFGEFVKTSGMRPLGVAGIFPYLKSGKVPKGDLEMVASKADLFTIEIDSEGQLLSRYFLPGFGDTMESNQLLMWMTHGPLINGAAYKYAGSDIIQPLQKPSLLLNQAYTVTPCFGGEDCAPGGSADWHDRLILGFGAPPQVFLHRDTLLNEIRSILDKLGYDRVEIDGPKTEIRVIDGSRRRVTAVYLNNRGGRAIDPQHVAMIQDFVGDRSPMGADFHVESA